MTKPCYFSGLCFCVVLGLIGCGPQHSPLRIIETGQPLNLKVKIPDDKVETAEGSLFYRLPASLDSYRTQTLDKRGNQLTATLNTEFLRPGQSVAYYFDIYIEGKLSPLASAQEPYVTEFLGRDEFIDRSLSVYVSHKLANDPLQFILRSGDVEVTRASVRYSPPDLVGHVVQKMEHKGRNWVALVDGHRVTPGAWTYSIEVEVDGQVLQLPTIGGDDHFTVSPANK